MDGTDLQLIRMLLFEPRLPYRELADRLSISVQAVHRRIQILMEERIILGFGTNISLRYLKAVEVVIRGISNFESRDAMIADLHTSDRISQLFFGSGNVIFVTALLRDISELETFVSFVSKAASMPDPKVSIVAHGQVGKDSTGNAPALGADLSPLDRRIIASMRRDARKPVADVATELNVTATTVKRRMDRMIADGSIEFSLGLHPGMSGNVISIINVTLREGSDKMAVGNEFVKRFTPTVGYYRTFSDVPDLISMLSWTNTLKELEILIMDVEKNPRVRSTVPHIIYAGRYFETWRDRLLDNVK
jgi:DNA-binding Lrp family transcriptional regulator